MSDDSSVASVPKQLTFTFRYDKDYKVVASNGVWVAITPRGDVRLEFFVESPDVPERVVHNIEPSGEVGKVVRREPTHDLDVIRSVQVGVLMSLKELQGLADLLNRQLKTWREAFEKKGE
jgi:hypothetical protein